MTLKSGFEITQGHSSGTIRKLGCGFLFGFRSNYGSILHHLRDKARYWSQIVIFFHTPLHSALPLGGPRRNIVIPFGAKKTRMVGLPDGETTLRICVTVYTQYRRVSDGQSDRHLATA